MCGINGFNFADKGLLQKMNDTTQHRGPDDSGSFFSSDWSLGHNRLSIIDLSPAGHQPMFDSEKKLAIVFNGEIYNFAEIKSELQKKGHEFFSRTDTEVIIYAYKEWGEDCLQKFNGIFSFAILDIEKELVFIARDRFGVKPLYYYNQGGKFIFSSEIKAILDHGVARELDFGALNIYFRLLYVPSPLTMFKNIYKLPPAHCATVDRNGKMISRKYWEISKSDLGGDYDEMKKEVRRLLSDSVKIQMMSDRPVGVFLSGGIDSTIIAGTMSKLSKKVSTFSVGFDVQEEAEKYNNDFSVARRTAKLFGTDHHELVLGAEDIAKNFERAIFHMDEPVSNHVQAVNLLLAEYTTKHVKVVLGGDGGDELFGGYERYYYNYLLDKFGFLRGVAKSAWAMKLAGNGSVSSLLKKLSYPPGVERYFLFFAQKEEKIAGLLKSSVNDPNFARQWYEQNYFQKVDKKNFTNQFMLTDLQTWLPDESLLRSDKMSMAVGLEERVPFLDHRLVEYAANIPLKYKIGSKGLAMFDKGKGYQGKKILKDAFSDCLPDFILNQPKWGWFSPASKWLRGPLRNYAEEVLSPSYNEGLRDMFDFEDVQARLKRHINKESYELNTIWAMLTFQVWYNKFFNK